MKARELGWRFAYLTAAMGIYLVDQVTKAWAVRELRFGDQRSIIDGILYLGYSENSGIAFGQFQNGGAHGRWFFTGLAAVAAVGVLIYLFRAPSGEDRVLGACAMLLAGIVGNMTDRFRLGYVIDFIDVFVGSFHWPTFNVADSAICAGAFLLLLDIFLVSRKERAAGAAHSQKTKSI